jgi:hypothetical protein
MLIYNKTDDYCLVLSPGQCNKCIRNYIAASSVGELDRYAAGEFKQKDAIRAFQDGFLERASEIPEGKDAIQVTYNPYHRYITLYEHVKRIITTRENTPVLDRFREKTYKQTITEILRIGGLSKGKASRKEWWTKIEPTDRLPLAHSQSDLTRGLDPTHLIKAESLEDDLNWYLGLKGLPTVTLQDVPVPLANPMGDLDQYDIKKLNTAYSEDFEEYGYTKL